MIKLTELLLEYGWIRKADRPRELPKLNFAYQQHDLAGKMLGGTGPMGLSVKKQDMALMYLQSGIDVGSEVFKFLRPKMDNGRAAKIAQAFKQANAELEKTYHFYDGESISRGFTVSADHCMQYLHQALDNISEYVFEAKYQSASKGHKVFK